MDVIELLPRLHFIRFPVGHAYLWQDPDGLTLVDAGLPGSAPALAAAVRHYQLHLSRPGYRLPRFIG